MIKKPKIAFFGVGLVGIPLLNQILTSLGKQYNLTIYSFMRVDAGSVPKGIKLRSAPNKMHQRLKYLLLGSYFLYDHLRSPYHLLHAQSAFPGGVLARRLGIICRLHWIVTLIGGEVECLSKIPFGDLRNHALRSITKRVCIDASVLTVMSHYQAQSVKNNLSLNRDIVVLPYAPVVRPWKEKKLATPLKLLHIAYHHPVKNHSMLLRCVDALRNSMPVHLTIIGSNYGERFRSEIDALGLQELITIQGVVDHRNLNAFFDDAHILVHTSWYEGLPAVAVEAMASGVVVCGTRVGIIADFADSFCVAVNVDDHLALASAILNVYNHKDRYENIRLAAYQWVGDNDQTNYLRQITTYYSKFLEGFGR